MFIDFIIDSFKGNLFKEAVVWKDRVYNYQYLFDRFNFWSEFLIQKQIFGKVVAIQSDYNPDSITLFLALIENKNIIVPFSNQNKGVEEKLEIAEANYFIKFNDDGYQFEHLNYKSTHIFLNTIFKKKHPGIIVFSSGSTGEPKAALHDFTLLLNKFKTKRKTLRTIIFLLFDHWGGVNTLLSIFSNAGVICIPEERTPDYVCNFIEKYKIELLPTTPSFLNLILLNESYKKYDLSSLQMITYGTEPMYEATLKAIHSILPNVELKQTYGLTELGVFRTKSKSSDSLWLKVGGEDYETKIVDGIFYVKAKTSIIGYLNAESPFDSEGWYNTGDRVEIDGEWIKFLGRDSDIINVGGQKVFPAEVESVLLEIPAIKDCVVYGEKNAILGNIVTADIILKNPEESTNINTIVRQYCKVKLETYKIPVRITVVDSISIGERFKKARKR